MAIPPRLRELLEWCAKRHRHRGTDAAKWVHASDRLRVRNLERHLASLAGDNRDEGAALPQHHRTSRRSDSSTGKRLCDFSKRPELAADWVVRAFARRGKRAPDRRDPSPDESHYFRIEIHLINKSDYQAFGQCGR
jgi:hypothetical protein